MNEPAKLDRFCAIHARKRAIKCDQQCATFLGMGERQRIAEADRCVAVDFDRARQQRAVCNMVLRVLEKTCRNVSNSCAWIPIASFQYPHGLEEHAQSDADRLFGLDTDTRGGDLLRRLGVVDEQANQYVGIETDHRELCESSRVARSASATSTSAMPRPRGALSKPNMDSIGGSTTASMDIRVPRRTKYYGALSRPPLGSPS